MPSPTDIINDALDGVNISPISHIDDQDAKSVRCKRIYEIRRAVLQEKEKWHFLTKKVSLAEDATTPLNEWGHQYQLPADCRRPIKINDDESVEFEQEGRKILTDATAPIILEYTADGTDPNIWDAAFTEAMISYLSWRYAKAFPQDGDKADKEFQEYKDAMGEAVAKNGQTGTPPRPNVNVLTRDTHRF